jgi:hypothetical protein
MSLVFKDNFEQEKMSRIFLMRRTKISARRKEKQKIILLTGNLSSGAAAVAQWYTPLIIFPSLRVRVLPLRAPGVKNAKKPAILLTD